MILTFWRWVKNPSIFLVATDDIFSNSPTFKREWYPDFNIQVLSPLLRPIPLGCKMYVAVKNQSFPYNTSAVKVVRNIFTPSDVGTYFISSLDDFSRIMALIK